MSPSSTSTPKTCGFCGSPQEPIFVQLFGKEHQVGWKPCTCPEAVNERVEAETDEAKARALDYENALMERYRKAGIPKTFREDAFDASKEASWVVEQRKGLYIFGTPGTYKTRTAMAIAKSFIRMGRKAKVITAPRMFSAIRASFTSDFTEDEAIDRFVSPDLLVIDDLGKETPTGFVLEKLHTILDERMVELLPTIITSNYPRKDLFMRLATGGDEVNAAAIASRICGMTRAVELKREDARLAS